MKPKTTLNRRMKSAARLHAVQALFQMEHSKTEIPLFKQAHSTGNKLNPSGDSLGMVEPVYKALFAKVVCASTQQQSLAVGTLAWAIQQAAERNDAGPKISPQALRLEHAGSKLPRQHGHYPNLRGD